MDFQKEASAIGNELAALHVAGARVDAKSALDSAVVGANSLRRAIDRDMMI
jgi:hypothetical protein